MVKAFLLTLSAILCVFLIGFLDHQTGHEISLSIFFLIPVSMIVIAVNFWAGILTAFVSGLIWYYNDVTTGIPASHWLVPVWNSIMRMGYFFLHSFFLSRYIGQIKQNRFLATTDHLTGAYNSRFLREKISKISGNNQKACAPFSVVFFDMDNFKAVNDTQGHAAGDAVLITFSKTVMENTAEGDVFARIGGDEFALLLTNKNFNQAGQIIRKIIADTAAAFTEGKWPVSVSAGAVTSNTMMDYGKMSGLADQMLYRAKADGKNKIVHVELTSAAS